MTDTDHEYEHLRQLVGWTVSHPVAIKYEDASEYDETLYALVLRKPDNKHQQMIVTIFRDPEGNGPGFLEIRKEKYGT